MIQRRDHLPASSSMAPAGTDTVKLDPSGLRTVETRDPSAVSRLAMVG